MSRVLEFHVFTTRARSAADTSPMQFISAEQLEHYQLTEVVAALVCAAVLAVGLAGIIIACTGRALVIG